MSHGWSWGQTLQKGWTPTSPLPIAESSRLAESWINVSHTRDLAGQGLQVSVCICCSPEGDISQQGLLNCQLRSCQV